MKKLILCIATMLTLCSGLAKGDAMDDAWGASIQAIDKGNYAQAIRLLRPMAEQGHADAQFTLGLLYFGGLGVAKDAQEAVKWYRLAAAQGHADAQLNLAVRYHNGWGVGQDDREAKSWWRLAAMQGNAQAQFVLGTMYNQGLGVTQDDREAVRWWRLAAAQGFVPAQYKLGIATREKDESELDFTTVLTILSDPRAADTNTAPSQTRSWCFGKPCGYVDRFVYGGVKGMFMWAVVVLIIIVVVFIRKVTAPARNATALTAAVGATAMQRLRQRMADYVGGIRECPFCKETVKIRAVVCKHCHRDI